jgi:hypothetical protein
MLEANSRQERYVVEFGIVGQVADVTSHYLTTKQQFEITTNMKVVGLLAKMVTGNLREKHICKGVIKKGLHYTKRYEMHKQYGEYKSYTYYKANHQTKTVTRHYKRWKEQEDGSYKLIEDYKKELPYYGRADLITFFLNLNQTIKKKTLPHKTLLKVIGADRLAGRVDITIPPKEEHKVFQILLGNLAPQEWYTNITMYRKLYNSNKGELLVRMGRDSMIEYAVLRDILLYGDVRIIRKN